MIIETQWTWPLPLLLQLNIDIETHVRNMSTRRRIPSKSTEDVGDPHCHLNTNIVAFYVCLMSILFSLLGCGPSNALPGARAAVYEWKPGSGELQQVRLSPLNLFIMSSVGSICLDLSLCFFSCAVSWLLYGTTPWRSSTRWLISINSKKGLWCSARDWSILCRLVLSFCSVHFNSLIF